MVKLIVMTALNKCLDLCTAFSLDFMRMNCTYIFE